jgi:ABC-2 type transport system permease protein
MTPLLPLALLIPYYTSDLSWTPLLMGPLVAFLLGWSEHNAVAYEAEALWLHIVAGTSGRDDRRGRLVPGAFLALALVPVYAVVGVAVAGRWDLLVAVAGLCLGLLGAGYAVSSVMSVVLPYPVAASGESPFNAPPGAAGITIVAQSLASVGTVVLASPVVVLAWFAWQGSVVAAWATGAVGVGTGAVVALAGIRVGAGLYDRRAPELLATLRRS